MGVGASRLSCVSREYEHYWMWRVLKVAGSGGLRSGDEVHLSVYQPMFHYCKSGAQVACGVDKPEATKFVVEKESGSGSINLARDSVYLKVGSSYCGLSGGGRDQVLRCALPSRSGATPFQLPASSYASVQLVNTLSNYTCGGDFYGQTANPPPVACGVPFIGLAANLTLALQTPGAPRIPAAAAAASSGSGAGVAFKTYEDLYTYTVATWKVDASKKVYLDSVSTEGAAQWFTISPFPSQAASGGASGGGSGRDAALVSGALVALRSRVTGQFCGISSAEQAAMRCDRAGPLAALPAGYRFTFISAPAALRPYTPLPEFQD